MKCVGHPPEGAWDTGLTIAGLVPGANDVAAILSLLTDTVKTAVAVGKCQSLEM